MRMTAEEYHDRHPEIWRLFVRFALQVIARGVTRYSSKAIFERIRWHEQIERGAGEEFKLNNNYTPYYARRFQQEFPRFADIFETRRTS